MHRWFVLCAQASLLLSLRSADAEEPQVFPATPVEDVASAKELNRSGLVHYDAGDLARALSFFQSSRALVPSHANTRNVALCLDGLDRKAEALRAYEALLRDWSDRLSTEERAATERRIAELGREVAPPAEPPRVAADAPAPPKPRGMGRFTTGVFLGYAGAPSLGSDAEAHAASTWTNGLLVGARAGYRVGSVISLELSGGYLRLGSAFQREMTTTFGATNDASVRYRLDEALVLQGPFGALGVSARVPIGTGFGVVGRLGVAGLAAAVSNEMSGTATGERGDTAPLVIGPEQRTVWSGSLLVVPEIGFEASFGGFVLGVGASAVVSTISGARFGARTLLPANASTCTLDASSVACAPQDSEMTSGERAHGPFVALVPQVSARYQFD